MKRFLVLLLTAAFAFAQTPAPQAPTPEGQQPKPKVQKEKPGAHEPPAPTAKRGKPHLPYIPVLDVSAMDKNVDPCSDLYTYSCGAWMKKNPIPSDQASWSYYGKLQDENRALLHEVLAMAAKSDPKRGI